MGSERLWISAYSLSVPLVHNYAAQQLKGKRRQTNVVVELESGVIPKMLVHLILSVLRSEY